MKAKAAATMRMIPMIITMGIIFLLSHQPGSRLPLPQVPGLDKLVHMIVYGFLAATMLFAFSDRRKQGRPRQTMVLTVIFCLLYGITDEYHQSFIPGRTASVLDLLADGTGAAMLCALWRKWQSRVARDKFLRSPDRIAD